MKAFWLQNRFDVVRDLEFLRKIVWTTCDWSVTIS